MHPVDEEVLRAAQIDLRDLAQRKPSSGRQQAAHVQVEAAGRRPRPGHVGDLTVGVEAILRQDGNFVRIDGRVGFIEFAGDAHDAAGGERADALAVVPLGISGYVDGELAAMRALHDEGLGGDIDADDGGIELVDVGAGVCGADRADVEGRGDLAGDLAIAVDQDRLAQIEIEMQTGGPCLADDDRCRRGVGDGGCGQCRSLRWR